MMDIMATLFDQENNTRPYGLEERKEECVQNFIDASKKSIDAKSKQQVGALKNAVMACYKAWQNLAKYLEARSIADALPGVQDAIDQLNAMNTSIKRRFEARKSSKTDDNTDNIVEMDDNTVGDVVQSVLIDSVPNFARGIGCELKVV